jgi:CspA family cold shock protein
MQGVCKWFDAKKGYGFLINPEVVDDEGQVRDIFVHWTKITMDGFKKLEQGETVEFDLVFAEDSGKPQADNVSRGTAPAPEN